MSINSFYTYQTSPFSSSYCYKNLQCGNVAQNSIFSEVETEKTNTENDMNAIAHRGYSSIAPENTLSAFKLAAEYGFETIECDIEWTKDNVPVILHDSTINRTARKEDGSRLFFPRKCSNMTYEELLKYDFGSWFSKDFKGEKIPSLYETLKCGKENDLNLYLELKETKNFDAEKAQILKEAVVEAGLEDKVTFISFNENYLKMMKEAMPSVRLGFLSKKQPSQKTIEILKGLQTEENEVFLDIKSSKISKETSEMLKEAGFSFESWTVDDKDLIDDLYSYGCEGITTNEITDSEIDEIIN